MTDPDFAHLAALHTLGDDPVPPIVLELAGERRADLVWRNELGGLTFRIDDRYLKWNPRRTGVDLERERVRLEWISLATRRRALASGADDEAQWLLTAAVPGETVIGDTWRSPPAAGDPGHRHRPARHRRHPDRRRPGPLDVGGLGGSHPRLARPPARSNTNR